VASELEILPYTPSAAEWHATERARLEGIGRPPAFVDGQIAAIAAVEGLVLVTRDTGDFAGFRDLRTESGSAADAGPSVRSNQGATAGRATSREPGHPAPPPPGPFRTTA
jgi:hypothetical protein